MLRNKTLGAAFAQGGMPGVGGPMVPPAAGTSRPGMPMGGGHLPFASGTVTAVDVPSGLVTVMPTFGGAAGQTIRVTGTTQITAQVAVKVSDLKVGDTVQVRGVPTGMTVTQITAGEGSDPFMAGPNRPGAQGGAGMAYAQASGRIASLSPLTITISDAVSVVLKPAPDVRVMKTESETVGDLKVGDRLMANGQPGDDNVLTAARIRVNSDYGMGGARLPPRPGQPVPMPQMPQMPK